MGRKTLDWLAALPIPRPKHPAVAYLFWSLAFWATAVAYVFDARGQAAFAFTMVAVALAYLAPLLLPPRASSQATRDS